MRDIVAALRAAGEQARQAADGPTRQTRLCRECDHQWVSDDPICLFCKRPTPPQKAGTSLWDPTRDHGNNIGIPHSAFEAAGLG